MRTLALTVLLAGTLGANLVSAQDRPEPTMPPPALREQMQQVELRNRALDVQEREEKLRFLHDMNTLQLEKCRLENDRMAAPQPRYHRHPGCLAVIALVCGVIHLLAATWVYQDIKRRNSGSGIWIALALLAGLCGTAVYALVRIGDCRDTRAA